MSAVVCPLCTTVHESTACPMAWTRNTVTTGGYFMTAGCGMAYLTVASGAGPHDFAVCAERKRVSGYYEAQLATLRAALAKAEAERDRMRPVVEAAVKYAGLRSLSATALARATQTSRMNHAGDEGLALHRLGETTTAYLAGEPGEAKS